MSWIRIDDNMADHPKVMGLGNLAPLALGLQMRALCWASRHLTDGYLPKECLPSLVMDLDAKADWPAAMVKAGLWEKTGDGYTIHDYLMYNPSREETLAARKRNADRQRKFRNGGSNGAVTRDNNVSSGVSNGVSNGPVTLPPSPSPTPIRQSPSKALDTLYPKKWLRPFGEAWQTRCGESIPWERLEASLLPLCEKFKCAPVLTAFRGYLNDTEPRYASPARFAATSAQWGLGNGSVPKGPHYPTADEADRAAGIPVPPKT